MWEADSESEFGQLARKAILGKPNEGAAHELFEPQENNDDERPEGRGGTLPGSRMLMRVSFAVACRVSSAN